jgi:hypothetical protein
VGGSLRCGLAITQSYASAAMTSDALRNNCAGRPLVVIAMLTAIGMLTAIPARIEARRPVAEVLRAELA